MVIPRKFLFQNYIHPIFCFYYQNNVAQFSLLWHQTASIRLNWGGFTWWRGYNNHISCLMFPAASRRSVRVSSRSVREPITNSEDWLCIPISAVTEHCTCVNTRNGRWSSSFNGGCYYGRCYVETEQASELALRLSHTNTSIKHVSTARCISILTNTRGSCRLFWRSK